MANENGKAYGLTVLCPIRDDKHEDRSFAATIRERLHNLPVDEKSPMAKVPNTYLCRFFVLDDLSYQGKPALSDHLQSKYLVFVCELHGQLDVYLQGMWKNAEGTIRSVWEYCIGFEGIEKAEEFVSYIKRCQVTTTFYFNGSTDESLAEQLKALYLKQEFGKFVRANQGKRPADLQKAFLKFLETTDPSNPAKPAWSPGASSLEVV
jgi:hypothetical protein